MKYLFIILSLLIMVSCGYETPAVQYKGDFVIGKIKSYNETHCVFIAKESKFSGYPDYDVFRDKQAIVLPCDWYKVGDTVNLVRKIDCQ